MTTLAATREQIVRAVTALPNAALEPQLLTDEQLLLAVERSREVHSALARLDLSLAGEIAHRSLPERGPRSLARRGGHANAAQLVAERLETTVGEAARLIRVAEVTRPRVSDRGEVLPGKFPLVQSAIAQGAVSLEAAHIITNTLNVAAANAPAEDVAMAEEALIGVASEHTLAELKRSSDQLKNGFAAANQEATDRERRTQRMLIIRQLRNGLTRIEWELPPEDAALVVAAIESACRQANLASGRTGFSGTDDGSGSADAAARSEADLQFEPALTDREGQPLPVGAGALHFDADGRPSSELAKRFAQARSDAAVEVFRHSARCRCDGRKGVPVVTAVVRVTLDQLRMADSAGLTSIDGVNAAIGVGTARRMAAAAGVIPAVMGGDSLPLDLGQIKRHFTQAQRLALIERDGGCAAPGCQAPPAWTDVHHLDPWSQGGQTDLNNGVVLCSAHHHRIHDNGWQIRIEPANADQPGSPSVPWFYPPASWLAIDPKHRRRIRGGRVQMDLVA